MKHFSSIFAIVSSAVGLLGVIVILSAALILEFFYGQQPCPLCLLQRAAFASMGIAFILNLRYGHATKHWALALLSALAGIAVSIRQILLHVNDAGYGSPVAGLHLYTWCFIGFAIAILGAVIVLLICDEKNKAIINR